MTDIILPTNPRFVNLTGLRINRLTVMLFSGKKGRSSMWLCRCDCGNEITVQAGNIRNSGTKSCGCLRKENTTTHGMRKTTEYGSWSHAKSRCTNPTDKAYKNYGGRGITICDRWLESFENFLEDMGLKPSPKHSIDRIDNELGYSKENCRWATAKEQGRNTRANRMVDYQGVKMSLVEAAEKSGIEYNRLKGRLRIGWDIKDVLRA